jgi:hypothetical protein
MFLRWNYVWTSICPSGCTYFQLQLVHQPHLALSHMVSHDVLCVLRCSPSFFLSISISLNKQGSWRRMPELSESCIVASDACAVIHWPQKLSIFRHVGATCSTLGERVSCFGLGGRLWAVWLKQRLRYKPGSSPLSHVVNPWTAAEGTHIAPGVGWRL